MGVKDEQRFGSRADKRPARQSGRAYGQQSEFINRELTKEEIVEYRAWREDVDNVVSEWSRLLEGGYRLNTKWDDYSSAYAAFAIPADGGDNSGFILAGRGGTPYRAVAECLYKHVFIFRGEWHNAEAGRDLRSDPDF